jgi:hypothetical protein
LTEYLQKIGFYYKRDPVKLRTTKKRVYIEPD